MQTIPPSSCPGAKGLPTTRRGPKDKVNGDVKGSGQLNSDLRTRQVGFLLNRRLRRGLPSQGCGVWPCLGLPTTHRSFRLGGSAAFCPLSTSQAVRLSSLSVRQGPEQGLLSCHQGLFLIHVCDLAWQEPREVYGFLTAWDVLLSEGILGSKWNPRECSAPSLWPSSSNLASSVRTSDVLGPAVASPQL